MEGRELMDIKMITALHSVLDAVVDEAENNEDFAGKLERAFTGNSSSPVKKRKVHRRQKPVLNPLDMIEDMHALDAKLHTLSVDQLKDIVSVYSMDPSRRALQWRKPERLIALILDVSQKRLAKGNAFRE